MSSTQLINYESRKNLVVGPEGALSQLCVITLTDGGPISAVFGPLCLASAPPTSKASLELHRPRPDRNSFRRIVMKTNHKAMISSLDM